MLSDMTISAVMRRMQEAELKRLAVADKETGQEPATGPRGGEVSRWWWGVQFWTLGGSVLNQWVVRMEICEVLGIGAPGLCYGASSDITLIASNPSRKTSLSSDVTI